MIQLPNLKMIISMAAGMGWMMLLREKDMLMSGKSISNSYGDVGKDHRLLDAAKNDS